MANYRTSLSDREECVEHRLVCDPRAGIVTAAEATVGLVDDAALPAAEAAEADRVAAAAHHESVQQR